MSDAVTSLNRLTQLAGAGQLPAPVKEREFYVYLDGQNQLKTEGFIAVMLAKDPGLSKTLPVVLPSDTAGGWKTPADYNIAPAAPLAPPAPMTPPAPPAPPAPPVQPVEKAAVVVEKVAVVEPKVQQAVLAPAQPAAPPQPVAPASLVPAVPTSSVPATMSLPEAVNDGNALAVLQFLTSAPAADTRSISDIVNEVADAGGMSHKLPIAQIRKGNWDVPKQIDTKISDHLPMGNRPYTAIYLCYRLAATGWQGSGTNGSGGKPPLWRFALPHPRVNASAYDFIKEVTRHSRNVQMTPGLVKETGIDKKAKFDAVGRMTPELHILCWRPGAGFFILVVGGYGSVTETCPALDDADRKGMVAKPCSFEIEKRRVENKKVMKVNPTAANAFWDEEFLQVKGDGSDRGLQILKEWQELQARDPVSVTNTLLEFMHTKDFEGMPLNEVEGLLKKYNEIPDEPRSR